MLEKSWAARRAASLLALPLLLASSGCVHSDAVTPWLRTSSYHPFELYAESGSGSGAWSQTERLSNGKWLKISGSDRAMAVAGGKLAVYVKPANRHDQLTLTNEAGDEVALDCNDQLRARPDGKGLVCVSMPSHWLQAEDQNTIRVSTIDLSGKTTRVATLTLAAKTLPRSFFPHFPGFLKDGTPVLTAHVNAEVETYRSGQEKLCAAFALRADEIVPLKALVTASWPDCDQARFWRGVDLEVVEGETMKSAAE